MSYEGYEEYLCEKGHYFLQDAMDYMYGNPIRDCPYCGAAIAWKHCVDETNGYCSDDPSTYPAETKEIGFTNEWREDHYGNKYAVKQIQYAPASKEWSKMP